MQDCRRCAIGGTRTHLVFGTGSPDAELMFIGEAPGADEDRQGEPFVGAAGQLLTRMIQAMGYTRDDVYIANILKCRPPHNRTPEGAEIANCIDVLHEQIRLVAPKVLCLLGRCAAQCVLGTDAPLRALRGRFHAWNGIPTLPTYHPAYLLRTPADKKIAWGDLQKIMERLGRKESP